MKIVCLAAGASLLLLPWSLPAQSKGAVIEEIVARVNNDVISLSDFQKADAALRQEIGQSCQGCSPEKLEAEYKDRSKTLLRDLIDQQLLIQRGKDMGLSVETEVIKRLDDVRKQNGMASLEELEKAVEGEGLTWEDYKSQIRNSLLTQEVIRKEVGSRINIGQEEVKQYYDQHKEEFNRPELVVLADIFLSTEGRSPEEAEAVYHKAEDLHNRVARGEEFSELAKRYSEGPTAKEGGALGTYERGQLSKQIEDVVFKMNKDQLTDIIQTKTGYEILKVLDHYQAGLQPMDKVQNEIMNRIYLQKMQPNLRDFLAQLREESYVTVKPGYTDTAAVPGASVIQEVSPTPDTPQKNKKKLPKPKVSG
jgi:peptidyl-prolyl cis-trans isomerase SurA